MTIVMKNCWHNTKMAEHSLFILINSRLVIDQIMKNVKKCMIQYKMLLKMV